MDVCFSQIRFSLFGSQPDKSTENAEKEIGEIKKKYLKEIKIW